MQIKIYNNSDFDCENRGNFSNAPVFEVARKDDKVFWRSIQDRSLLTTEEVYVILSLLFEDITPHLHGRIVGVKDSYYGIYHMYLEEDIRKPVQIFSAKEGFIQDKPFNHIEEVLYYFENYLLFEQKVISEKG